MDNQLMFNPDLIREKTSDIRGALRLLDSYAGMPYHTFARDITVISAAKYQLVVAIEAAQSICNHLAARIAHQAPASYAECFGILAENAIISQELAARLANMARFRNLLVHQYGKVDTARLFEILQEDIQDMKVYVKQIHDYVIFAQRNTQS